ncbi:MAG: SUMF1/EgtB/PvdO family nonheme iron enzyme [Polyangiaceae bacterium]|nr:SUMF1/EgtB/PvdO family nonheme iron enzyme [Polyangiaceae bacterium]
MAYDQPGRGCPAEMARVLGFCVDRWEVSLVDQTTGADLSPYYPPHPTLIQRVRVVWEIEREQFGGEAARRMPLPDLPAIQRTGRFVPRAVSRPGTVPQGYLTYYLARTACENAGKRLCTEAEWVTACRGEQGRAHPYGATYEAARCNVHRAQHPAFVLHANSSAGHTDPRLNLVVEAGADPLLRLTGATPTCRSTWGDNGVFDMVGNVDEWIADEAGVFVGGFYARATTKGCDARISNHSPSYYDYSLGTRCCRDADRAAVATRTQ